MIITWSFHIPCAKKLAGQEESSHPGMVINLIKVALLFHNGGKEDYLVLI